MPFVYVVLFVLVGCLLAIPYCLLAGWSWENYPIVALVTLFFLLIWYSTAFLAGIVYTGQDGKTRFQWRAAFGKGVRLHQGTIVPFWTWTFFCLLPIIVHWSAWLLGKIGYETIASHIDGHRYATPFYFFAVNCVLIIFGWIITVGWDKTKKAWSRIWH